MKPLLEELRHIPVGFYVQFETERDGALFSFGATAFHRCPDGGWTSGPDARYIAPDGIFAYDDRVLFSITATEEAFERLLIEALRKQWP